jgi:fumarate hydratase class I
MSEFSYQPIFEFGPDETPYRRLDLDGVSTVTVDGQSFLKVAPAALRGLSRQAFDDIAHLLRPGHLAQLKKVVDDPESSANDKFVAMELLRNANIASGRVLPGCQDTGTAIIMGHKGERVLTGADDAEALSHGVYDAYTERNLRYSQMAPLDMFTEKNTASNLPAQVDILSEPGDEYELLFVAKGGGSANKTFLYQETKALLNPTSLLAFVEKNLKTIGTSACPPYHLALVIGGPSAEFTMKTVKLASTKYLDRLPTTGNEGGRAFRDLDMERQVLEIAERIGVGAQFGGKYFAHDARVIRLPRHGASCPVGLGVSCSADRQALAKITREGVFLEQLEENPAQYLPEITDGELDGDSVRVDLNRPMSEILAELSKYPVATRLSLTGTMVVARDIAHAKLKERLDAGQGLPQYLKDHMVYYAGPAKKPEGRASGSFGPTTAGRMDSYVDLFQSHGGSMVMLAKGNRSRQVTDACAKHGGFYLGSIGGPAARLADHSIRKVEVLEYPELGMEAIWRIDIEEFPAFIIVDDKGNDFYAQLMETKPATLIT